VVQGAAKLRARSHRLGRGAGTRHVNERAEGSGRLAGSYSFRLCDPCTL